MARGQPQGEEGLEEPRVEPEDLPRKLTPEIRDYAPLAPGLESLGAAVQAHHSAQMATLAGNQLADLNLSMTQQVEDAKTTAQPGAPGFGGQINQTFNKAAAGLIKGANDDPALLEHLIPGLNAIGQRFNDEAIRYEAEEGLKYRFSSARDNSDKLALIASRNPDQFQSLMEQSHADITGRNLGPDGTLAALKYSQSAIAKSAVLSRAMADPYNTMKALLQPEEADRAITALNPQEREEILNRSDMLLHQRVADAERLEAMQDKKRRMVANETLVGFIAKSEKGELTTAEVLSKRALFADEPSAFAAALDWASGKKVETDVSQFAPRYAAAARGETTYQGEDIGDWALRHAGVNLSQGDFEKLVGFEGKGVPTAYKAGLDFINDNMKPPPGEPFIVPAVHQNHANAVEAYNNFIRQNPGATPVQASAYAHQLVNTYSLVQLNNVRLGPVPRFNVGGRQHMDIPATEDATVKAFQAGAISREEFDRESALIKQWADAYAKAAAAAAAKPKAQ